MQRRETLSSPVSKSFYKTLIITRITLLVFILSKFYDGWHFTEKKELAEVKKDIALCSKRNFNIEKDIATLDQKIALLIKNRITLEVISFQIISFISDRDF